MTTDTVYPKPTVLRVFPPSWEPMPQPPILLKQWVYDEICALVQGASMSGQGTSPEFDAWMETQRVLMRAERGNR